MKSSIAAAVALLIAFFVSPLHVRAADKEVNLLAMGDWGSNKPDQRTMAATMAKCVKSEARQFDGMLLCGDNFYVPLANVFDPKWKSMFEDLYDPKILKFPFYVSLGNHDYQQDRYLVELAYAKANPESRWKFPDRWYRLEFPDDRQPLVTVLMLDSNKDLLGPEKWQEELEWLTEQVSYPRRSRWLIAAAHHPFFSNGDHGDNGVLQHTWGPLFAAARLDFYICGHDHDIQHLELPGYKETFLLVGGGGAATRPMRLDRRGPFSKSTHGFADLNFTAEKATVRLIGPDAKPLHEFTRTREGVVEMKKTVPSDPAVPRTIKSITRGGQEPATTRASTTREVED